MHNSADERIAKWDNAKALLILLVVTGHALYDLLEVSSLCRTFYMFIYLFHMPLFMFLSGLLLVRTVRTGYKLKQRVIGYLILGFLLKFIVLLVRLPFGYYEIKKFYMWEENSIPWYLLVLAAYLLLTWCLRNMPGGFLLFLAFLFGCLAGYDKAVGALFSSSRFFVYYPFFLLGTFWDRTWTDPASKKYMWKTLSAVFLAAVLFFLITNIESLYPYIELIKGGYSYPSLKSMIGADQVRLCGFYRLLHYCLSSLISAAVLILIPSETNLFTYIGTHTLPIYMFHRLFQLPVVYSGLMLQTIFPPEGNKWKILYLLAAPLITLILSHPVFMHLEAWFWRQLKDL